MDLLESGDERVQRPLAPRLLAWRPPTWVLALVAATLLATTVSGLVAAAQLSRDQAREAARLEVDVRPAGSSSSTVGGVARGELALLLVNRREGRVRLGRLGVAVAGLRVTAVEPAFGKPLGPYEERLFRIAFVVPDCSRLVLPGRLQVSLAADRQPVQRRELAVVDPDQRRQGPGGFVLAGCPPSARGPAAGTSTDVGVRPAGGRVTRTGGGAEGVLRLEVRNGGRPVRLVSFTGQVPGVRFTPRSLDGGRSLETDGLVLVRLAFTIADCAALAPTGRLVLVVERFGAQQEVALPIAGEPAQGRGPQVELDLLFNACG